MNKLVAKLISKLLRQRADYKQSKERLTKEGIDEDTMRRLLLRWPQIDKETQNAIDDLENDESE